VPDEIMTVSALARYLDCSPSTIYHRLLKKKQIPLQTRRRLALFTL
jgi:hypothetical protein